MVASPWQYTLQCSQCNAVVAMQSTQHGTLYACIQPHKQGPDVFRPSLIHTPASPAIEPTTAGKIPTDWQSGGVSGGTLAGCLPPPAPVISPAGPAGSTAACRGTRGPCKKKGRGVATYILLFTSRTLFVCELNQCIGMAPPHVSTMCTCSTRRQVPTTYVGLGPGGLMGGGVVSVLRAIKLGEEAARGGGCPACTAREVTGPRTAAMVSSASLDDCRTTAGCLGGATEESQGCWSSSAAEGRLSGCLLSAWVGGWVLSG